MTGIALSLPKHVRHIAAELLPHLRPRSMRTIRGRLAFGFGVTVILVATIAAVAVSALRTANAGNARALESLEQEFDGSQRVITAALREIASGIQKSLQPQTDMVLVPRLKTLTHMEFRMTLSDHRDGGSNNSAIYRCCSQVVCRARP